MAQESTNSSFILLDAQDAKPRVAYADDRFSYKIVVVGPSESGKTAFIQRFMAFDLDDGAEKEVYVKRMYDIQQAEGISQPKNGKIEIWDVLNA